MSDPPAKEICKNCKHLKPPKPREIVRKSNPLDQLATFFERRQTREDVATYIHKLWTSIKDIEDKNSNPYFLARGGYASVFKIRDAIWRFEEQTDEWIDTGVTRKIVQSGNSWFTLLNEKKITPQFYGRKAYIKDKKIITVEKWEAFDYNLHELLLDPTGIYIEYITKKKKKKQKNVQLTELLLPLLQKLVVVIEKEGILPLDLKFENVMLKEDRREPYGPIISDVRLIDLSLDNKLVCRFQNTREEGVGLTIEHKAAILFLIMVINSTELQRRERLEKEKIKVEKKESKEKDLERLKKTNFFFKILETEFFKDNFGDSKTFFHALQWLATKKVIQQQPGMRISLTEASTFYVRRGMIDARPWWSQAQDSNSNFSYVYLFLCVWAFCEHEKFLLKKANLGNFSFLYQFYISYIERFEKDHIDTTNTKHQKFLSSLFCNDSNIIKEVSVHTEYEYASFLETLKQLL